MDAHALVHRFAELCNAHDLDGFDAVIAADYRQHNPMVPDGLEGIRQGFADFLTVFPDLTATVEAVVAEQDLVAVRFVWEGTQRAEFFGVPASGARARWTSSDWWRVTDDRFIEHWDVVDWAGLMSQLTGPAQAATPAVPVPVPEAEAEAANTL